MHRLAAVVILLLLAAGCLPAREHTITVLDEGRSVPVVGQFETVAEVVSAAELDLHPEDLVLPALTETVEPGATVEIKRARPVTLRRSGSTSTLWTRTDSLGEFLREAGLTVSDGERIMADGSLVAADAINRLALPDVIEIDQFVTVTIDDGTVQRTLHTAADTVADALIEAGIAIDAFDGVEPEAATPLLEDIRITIRRAYPINIHVDGSFIQTETHHTEVSRALAAAGIALGELDYTIPELGSAIGSGSTIKVVRVTEGFHTEDESIPFHTLWQASADLLLDTTAILVEGEPGIQRRRIRIHYEDGIETSRSLDQEWIEREPVNRIVGFGTRIELGVIDTPDGPREYWRKVRMRVTSYTAASSGKEPGDPGYGITASGLPADYGIVAVDRAVVPFRSNVFVPGYGVGFVGDTGGGIRGRWIDLGYDENSFVSWSGYTDVYYLTPIPPADDINYLLPANLP